MSNDFYLRYYVGHKGKFGHEFLEFEFRPDGKLRLTFVLGQRNCQKCAQNNPRYANNSNYKNDTMIRKEAYSHQVNFFECDFELVGVEQALMGQFWRIIDDDEDDDEDGDDDDDFKQAVMDELAQKKIKN